MPYCELKWKSCPDTLCGKQRAKANVILVRSIFTGLAAFSQVVPLLKRQLI
jgi:hypothetical protein